MGEVGRLIAFLALAGLALTLVGGAVVWSLEEGRRMRRSLKKVLGCDPHALLTAPGRGRAIGFEFSSSQAAVTWDKGAWCLLYRLDEIQGAELIIDGVVVARAYRGEPRRALDQLGGAVDHVRLRFIFDVPSRPDFDLELWSAVDAAKGKPRSPTEAVQEGGRWITRTESLLRRPGLRPAPAVYATPPPRAEPPADSEVGRIQMEN